MASALIGRRLFEAQARHGYQRRESELETFAGTHQFVATTPRKSESRGPVCLLCPPAEYPAPITRPICIVAAQGRDGIRELLKIIANEEDARLPIEAHASLVVLAAGLQAVQTMIRSIEKRIIVQHRSNEASQRLETIPGIGVIGATAIAATVPDPKVFGSGRDFAAWIGLVPREDSTGARVDLETGRSLFATHSGGRRLRGIAIRAP
jgi:hypothetical protein